MTRKYNPKSKENLRPFRPDNPETGEKDERINRQGRARSFDELRALFQEIANQDVNGKTKIQDLGEKMMRDRKLMKTFLEFAYGKVPLSQIVDITSGGKPIGWKDFINDVSNTDTETSSE